MTLDHVVSVPENLEPLGAVQPAATGALSLTGMVRTVFESYATGDNTRTSVLMLQALATIEQSELRRIDDQENALIGSCLDNLLTVFCLPDFQIPEELGFQFLRLNAVIANVMAGCLETTTDPHLLKVRWQEQSLFKTMVLYSARNNQSVDISKLLLINPELGSNWLYQTWKTVHSGNCNEKVNRNLTRFLREMDERILTKTDLVQPYFGCTYLGVPEEQRAKSLMNSAIRRDTRIPILNQPDPKRIAIISDDWFAGHSVYRTLRSYVDALKPHFHLTLIHVYRDAELLDTASFDDVIRVDMDEARNLSPIEKNRFAAVIFPAVGMSFASIVLANWRIAPVQMMMTGHPASTFGSEIDYFISGQDVDLPALATQNYSERLVLLPGYGAVHDKPTYPIQGKPKTCSEVLINCSWTGQKIHWHCLDIVNEALRQSKSRVKLRIFSGNQPIHYNGYSAFARDLGRHLPNCLTELISLQAYTEYMEMMEEADFAIDVFPFAGSNTVSDNLYLRKATLTREGDRWFNRIGPAMLRSIGLDSLIATNDEEYIRKLVQLVDDAAYREQVTESIRNADLETAIYHTKGSEEFRQFVQNVAGQKNFYKGREPIVVPSQI